MNEHTGWLLDVYSDPQGGVILWLLDDDGQRRCLRQPFPITFYAAGPNQRLLALRRSLASHPDCTADLAERRTLSAAQPVLAIQVAHPALQPRLFARLARAFPDLFYFDADIPLPLRYAAAARAFALARCRLVADPQGLVHDLNVLDSPWDLDPPPPPLRLLRLEPDSDPAHRPPQHLLVSAAGQSSRQVSYRLALQPERPLLVSLRAILSRHDPDLLLTTFGDTWLLPHLLQCAHALQLPLPLNRDPARQPAHRPERSYFSYGQVVYRGRQVHLFGRWHIDCGNAMLWDDYQLEGVLEVARVTGLPVQLAARLSPGTGISSMQIITALRQGILVPWHKHQPETIRSAARMFTADQGGLVYQPLVGLHRQVAEIDFVSMYPGIMVHFNISPETIAARQAAAGPPAAAHLEKLPSAAGENALGLVPQTLAPLLEKRLAYKARLAALPSWQPHRPRHRARASAHKWLLVTCFGYLGYKNARFGRIEAHETVTAYAREALLRAKETAEDLGFTILHMYVDGLWLHTPFAAGGEVTPASLQPLLEHILLRTGLPIALEGIYRWIAFLPSRLDARLPVANRYFGVFQDGSLKLRGIEARRRDTPPFIASLQLHLLETLARDQSPLPSDAAIQGALSLLPRALRRLRAGEFPLPELLVTQRLSRQPDAYRQPSPVARAARQLQAAGRSLRPGQSLRFLYTRGRPGVHAWDQPQPPDPAALDLDRYTRLMLRAAHTVLQPFGVTSDYIQQTALHGKPARQLALPGRFA
ncbi:MAG: DNA polymerase domain-containing protein [Chloroflexota bacterium]